MRPDWLRGLALLALALASWGLPARILGGHYRNRWDWGEPDLAAAASLARASEQDRVAVAWLAGRDGSPGVRVVELPFHAGGLAATPRNLNRLARYLEEREHRSLFRREALGALRRGWRLNWNAERYRQALASRLGPDNPPDWEAFLSSMRAAPVSALQYRRLQGLSAYAWRARFPDARRAQRLYEKFAEAHAHFGDADGERAWLKRRDGLWPLLEPPGLAPPPSGEHEGAVFGRLLFEGRPASGMRLGLFTVPEGARTLPWEPELVESQLPDAKGRFLFSGLTPGRYVLGLLADPLLLSEEELSFRNAPGVIRLKSGRMRAGLFPIEIARR